MKTLVLAEKPSVGRDLARVLGCRQQHKTYIEGSRYIVTWALGHLVELKMPEDYDKRYETWRMEDLPIIPEQMELKVIRKTSAQFKAIQKLTKRKDIKELVIATDAGREGELVARWIIKKIHWRKPVKRLWISSQTDRAIREGFKQLKPAHAYDALYASAVCRAEADWLIGLNVTRALTTKYDDPLSAGRVQTPTLNIILEREHEIETFVPKEFRTLTAHFGSFSAQWEQNGDKRLFDLERAEQLSSTLKGEKRRRPLCQTENQTRAAATAVRLNRAAARRQQAVRFFCEENVKHFTAALRVSQTHHLPTNRFPLLDERHGNHHAQKTESSVGRIPGRSETSPRPKRPSIGKTRIQRSQSNRSPRHYSDG